MTTQFFSVGLIVLLGAMSPGPDFAIVTKNSLIHSRRSGIFTSLGVGCAILVHMSYCVFGLAVLIKSSVFLFNLIKYAGACYLIYLGLSSLLAKEPKPVFAGQKEVKKTNLGNFASFRQGFLCNVLNPKAVLFFLSIFTVIISPGTPLLLQACYALEIFIVPTLWFCGLTVILSHPYIKKMLEKAEKYIVKLLGAFLVIFGVVLALVKI